MAIDLATVDAIFHVPGLADLDDEGRFDPDEARHVSGSRRLKAGDALVVFNGIGDVAVVELTQIDPRGRSTTFRVVERHRFENQRRRVAMVAAVPKGDRQNTLLDMATQLGMTDYTPGLFVRSVTRPDAVSDRWQRVVLAACKQSRRPWLPQLHSPVTVDETIVAGFSGLTVLADVSGGRANSLLDESSQDVQVIVGPEGGLTDEERDGLVGAGAVALGVGDGTLRTETAAIALLAAVQSV